MLYDSIKVTGSVPRFFETFLRPFIVLFWLNTIFAIVPSVIPPKPAVAFLITLSTLSLDFNI